MNKILTPVALLLVLCISCQKEVNEELPDPYLKTDSTSLFLPVGAGGKDSFNIKSNIEWKITIQPATADWLSTNITTGNGSSKVVVAVTKNNTSDTVQKATITITPVNNTTVQSVTIFISQHKPAIKTRNTYGGTAMDAFYSAAAAGDGGFIAVGYTVSNNGDVSGLHGKWEDGWVIRIDANGNKVWQKALGGTDRDAAVAIIKTADANFLMLVGGSSSDGDFTGLGNGGGNFLIKIDGNGTILWKKIIGDVNTYPGNIIPAVGGGYMLVGTFNSAATWGDFWVAKINETGDMAWQKTFGGSYADGASSIVPASDNGYIIAGSSQSTNGDVTGNHGTDDVWIVKIDDNGNKVWQKSYGGSNGEGCSSIAKTGDGGYVLVGGTASNDGDVSGNHGNEDVWVIKIDAAGNKVWQKTLGGPERDGASHVIPASGGGFIVAGLTRSANGDVTNFHGETDVWIIKLGENGNMIWQKTFGGTDEEWADCIMEVTPGNYVFAGTTFSNDGDVVGLHGYGDAWLVKFN